ncbi:MAG: recombinase RecA [Candidatus Omnitrophica bacterium]|nr:recombinase RecA [Candidatus Omnitrophota bacterium]
MKLEKQEASLEKKIALQNALANIEKNIGKGSVMRLGDKPIDKVPVITTGCLSLDYALVVGGLPRGRIVEIYGPESGGKSSLAMQIVAQAQKLGGTCAYVDAEQAMDLNYANSIGVDVSNLYLSQPDSGEDALSIVEELVSSGAIDIIVVDSVAALTPKSEIEGEMGAATMGVQARLMGQALRKLVSVVGKTKTILIFINQLRQKLMVTWGSNEITPGGNALKFYSSVRLDIRRIESIKDKDSLVVGNKVKIKVVKNKVGPPFREVVVDIIFGKGIDFVADLVNIAVEKNVIQKSGSWYSYKDEKIGQGIDSVVEFLYNKPEVKKEIHQEVSKLLFN